MVLLASIGGELHGVDKLKMGVIFYFSIQFDCQGQDQSPHKSIKIFAKLFSTSGLNLVILAWTGHKLSRGQQVIDTHTHGHRQTQATTIPEGKNDLAW